MPAEPDRIRNSRYRAHVLVQISAVDYDDRCVISPRLLGVESAVLARRAANDRVCAVIESPSECVGRLASYPVRLEVERMDTACGLSQSRVACKCPVNPDHVEQHILRGRRW